MVVIGGSDGMLCKSIFFLLKIFFFLARSLGILVPQPGMGLVPPAVEAQSFNDTPVEEVPAAAFFNV